MTDKNLLHVHLEPGNLPLAVFFYHVNCVSLGLTHERYLFEVDPQLYTNIVLIALHPVRKENSLCRWIKNILRTRSEDFRNCFPVWRCASALKWGKGYLTLRVILHRSEPMN